MAKTTRRASISVDVAVVGGGLCGLALARTLAQGGRQVHVFEARTRLGGRIDAASCAPSSRVDLGPSWYWPESQPLMTRLVEQLGLRHFAQHDPGDALVVNAPQRAAQRVKLGPVHSGARRLAGSMVTLIEALRATLPAEQLHLGHALTAVSRRGQRLELHFQCDGQTHLVAAKRLVLALPPRLVAERVRFEPALSSVLRTALQDTPTWMANQAKVLLAFDAAAWRKAGHSGNGFVQHGQAAVREVFDACEESSRLSALGAFVALPPATRARLAAALPASIAREVADIFSTADKPTEQLYRDWAAEAYTCSELDAQEYSAEPHHPGCCSAELRKARWDRRLYFGGSETAEVEGGYMEGALHAAERIAREILRLETPEAASTTGSSTRTRAPAGGALEARSSTRASSAPGILP